MMKNLQEFKQDLQKSPELTDAVNCSTMTALIQSLAVLGYQTTPNELASEIKLSLSKSASTSSTIFIENILIS